MVDLMTARGMQVITSDGELIGTVEDATPDGINIARLGVAEGERQAIPGQWIDTVDRQVHLNRTGAEAVAGWRAMTFTGKGAATSQAVAAGPSLADKWIWVVLAVLVVLGILMLTGAIQV